MNRKNIICALLVLAIVISTLSIITNESNDADLSIESGGKTPLIKIVEVNESLVKTSNTSGYGVSNDRVYRLNKLPNAFRHGVGNNSRNYYEVGWRNYEDSLKEFKTQDIDMRKHPEGKYFFQYKNNTYHVVFRIFVGKG